MRDENLQLSARDKVVQKMSRDGAVENNISADTTRRVSSRIQDATLKDTPASELQLGGRAMHGDVDVQKRNNRYSGYLKIIRESNGSASANSSSRSRSKMASVDGRYNLKVSHDRTNTENKGMTKGDSCLQEKGSSLKQKQRLKKKQVRLQSQGGDSTSGHSLADGENRAANKKMTAQKKQSRLRFDDEAVNPSDQDTKRKGKPKGTMALMAYAAINTAADTIVNAAHASDVSDTEDENAGKDAVGGGASLVKRTSLHHEKPSIAGRSSAEGYGSKKVGSAIKHEAQEKKSVLRFEEDAGDAVNKANSPAKKPETKGKNKAFQKKRIKMEYAAAFKDSKNTGTSTKVAAEAVKGTADKVKAAVSDFAKKHPGVIVVAVVLGLFYIVSISAAGTFGTLVSELGGAVTESTYLSSDNDILAANDAYTDMENELQDQVDHIERDYPGYDEYRYQVDEITHDPYALTSYLTSMYGNFKYEDIKDDLKTLFQNQFHLELTDEVETRTRTVTNADGTTSEEEYEITILNVKLTNKGLDAIAVESLGESQQKLYAIYQASLGNRSYLFGDSITVGNPADGGMGYEIPGEALDDEQFANMIREAEKYLGMAYVWGGYSPTGGFDCSGFVSYVINHCGNGWDVGRLTANGLRGICAPVSSSEAKPGDLIFFQGTYNTSGASHVGIYVGNGMMIHCGNPIQYTSINSNYWQQHFLSYGRIGD